MLGRLACLIGSHTWGITRTPRIVFTCERCGVTRDPFGNQVDYALAR